MFNFEELGTQYVISMCIVQVGQGKSTVHIPQPKMYSPTAPYTFFNISTRAAFEEHAGAVQELLDDGDWEVRSCTLEALAGAS